mmetsp:Transcript_16167/g.35824  ORF Transcript_16167/g.35824 Transcript_16167/m.35824 type:complete len:254 (-) Transcript_16167:1070-1831(-)
MEKMVFATGFFTGEYLADVSFSLRIGVPPGDTAAALNDRALFAAVSQLGFFGALFWALLCLCSFCKSAYVALRLPAVGCFRRASFIVDMGTVRGRAGPTEGPMEGITDNPSASSSELPSSSSTNETFCISGILVRRGSGNEFRKPSLTLSDSPNELNDSLLSFFRSASEWPRRKTLPPFEVCSMTKLFLSLPLLPGRSPISIDDISETLSSASSSCPSPSPSTSPKTLSEAFAKTLPKIPTSPFSIPKAVRAM